MYKIRNTINIHEAKTHFSQLVDSAAKGREIYIAKAGVPVAKIVPLLSKKPKVRFGILKGKIRLADDFNAPLADDMLDLFEGK